MLLNAKIRVKALMDEKGEVGLKTWEELKVPTG